MKKVYLGFRRFILAGPSDTNAMDWHYTTGIKAQMGRFHSAYPSGLFVFLPIKNYIEVNKNNRLYLGVTDESNKM